MTEVWGDDADVDEPTYTIASAVDLRQACGLAVGAGSVMWENLHGTGRFNSEGARAIVEELVGWVEAHTIPRRRWSDRVPPPADPETDWLTVHDRRVAAEAAAKALESAAYDADGTTALYLRTRASTLQAEARVAHQAEVDHDRRRKRPQRAGEPSSGPRARDASVGAGERSR